MAECNLTSEHLAAYIRDGFVVIEGVLTDEEVAAVREAFHNDLRREGIDHEDVLAGISPPPAECAIKSPIADLYYSTWKMFGVHLAPRVVQTMLALQRATFLNPELADKFPGPSRPASQNQFAYIDRVCYRLPNRIRNEKGLALHLDRHPTKPFANIKKWRPIQAFVTLTDHWGGATGGLQVVPGFHHTDYFAKGGEVKESAGEFFRMTDHSYDRLRKELITVQAPKGSLVCWDNRLPHATCAQLEGGDSREVVFTGFLPDIELNRAYVAKQRECFLRGLSPPAYDSLPVRPPTFRPEDLSREQREMLGL